MPAASLLRSPSEIARGGRDSDRPRLRSGSLLRVRAEEGTTDADGRGRPSIQIWGPAMPSANAAPFPVLTFLHCPVPTTPPMRLGRAHSRLPLTLAQGQAKHLVVKLYRITTSACRWMSDKRAFCGNDCEKEFD